jgi:hypothetical protein
MLNVKIALFAGQTHANLGLNTQNAAHLDFRVNLDHEANQNHW